MLVVSDRANYRIKPHTDSPARFISLLYYLSPDLKYQPYGIGLYQPKDEVKLTDPTRHYQFDRFTLHHLVEYRPNRVLIFPRTDKSYHGVQAVDVGNCDRRLLIVNIRTPEGVLEIDQ